MPPPTYQNFDLLITPTTTGYTARVINAPAGQAKVDFVLPFQREELRTFFWLSGRVLRNLASVDDDNKPTLDPQNFGARLYGAVFAGAVETQFLRSLDAAERAGAGLRLRLWLADAPELADLPWEYLYAPSLARHLALSQETPLVRYLELAQPEQALTVRPPLRILAVVANPSDVRPLAVEQEWRQLHDALADLQSRQLLRLERLEKPTLAALQARLRGDAIHIFHFIGHGDFDADQQTGGLYFEQADGKHHLVDAERLATLLHDHAPLRLAFLNACQGAQGSGSDPFAGMAQKLVQQDLPSVVAMQFPVSDKAAITLAYTFYKTLAEGYPVDAALAEARKALYTEGDDREWGTPVLFSRSADNGLLTLPEGDARPHIERQPWEPETVLVEGGNFWMGSAPGDGIPVSETPRHQVYLPDYRISRTPITNRQYAHFLKRTSHAAPPKQGWFLQEPPAGKEEHPVTGVSWYDAVAYCTWLRQATGRAYRLPTEAEWEKAAGWQPAHQQTQRYTWDDEWQDGCCNVNSAATTPVDAYPAGASPAGCLDLLGNAQEWTSTRWGSRRESSDYPYPYQTDDGREAMATVEQQARVYFVHRGGCYRDQPAAVYNQVRGVAGPDSAVSWRGFRVVMMIGSG